MNKTHLIEAISQNLTKTDIEPELTKPTVAKKVVDLFFNQITSSLQAGESVQIRGFGNFTKKKYRGYVAHNPSTGKMVKVPEKYFPVFRASKKLLAEINKNKTF